MKVRRGGTPAGPAGARSGRSSRPGGRRHGDVAAPGAAPKTVEAFQAEGDPSRPVQMVTGCSTAHTARRKCMARLISELAGPGLAADIRPKILLDSAHLPMQL